MPKQTPKTGCDKCGMSLSKAVDLNFSIAALAWPTPGKTTRSAVVISSLFELIEKNSN